MPRYAVGRIIGRQGATIKTIEADTAAKIDVARESREGDDSGLVEIRATPFRPKVGI